MAYQLTPWQDFGEIPVEAVRILDFIDKTSATISYVEPDTTKKFTCKESIAYLELDSGDVFRCCNSPEKISCVKNDSSNTYVADRKCEDDLSKLFGIPQQLHNTKEYKKIGYCTSYGNISITVVQITDNQRILWKSIDAPKLYIASFGLKCFVAPLFIVLALLVMMKNTKK